MGVEVGREIEWGTAEDVKTLNQEILSCLEIEGIPPPANLFAECVYKIENFVKGGV